MSLSLTELRSRHPKLVFQDFAWHLADDGLHIEWHYQLEPTQPFQTKLVIPGVTATQLDSIPEPELRQLLLQLGVAELVSYWKLSCSPTIEIAAGWLSPAQIQWWHELLINGLGEFFYVNQINFTEPDFVHWQVTAAQPDSAAALPDWHQAEVASYLSAGIAERVLVPMGGGKDSAVTLKIAQQQTQATALLINPTAAAQHLTKEAGVPSITVRRTLDPRLIELNHQGYLNGHVPISSVFAWISVLVGRVLDFPQVLISNERSSNEGNVSWLGQEINHQYSKTFAFEQHFQQYVQTLGQGRWPWYFSFVRPLYELQIARIFVHQHPDGSDRALSLFRSCNRGQKTNVWCGECPKCLFAYSILAPFLPATQLQQLFGRDLWSDQGLIETALELVGAREQKPLECVGTREENTIAFWLTCQTYHHLGQPLPIVLAAVEREHLAHQTQLPERSQALLDDWNEQHHLPQAWAELLKTAVQASQAVTTR